MAVPCGCAVIVPVCVSLLLSFVASPITSAPVRGVAPDLIAHYDTNADVFRCLDGSKSIQTGRVNDEYCDCFDGSDEPGRSRKRMLQCMLRRTHCNSVSCLQARPPVAMVAFIVAIEVTSQDRSTPRLSMTVSAVGPATHISCCKSS